MVTMAGASIGMMTSSYLSDRFGRKPVCVMSSILNGGTGIVQSFSVNAVMYGVTRTLVALFSAAFFTPAFSLMIESVSTDRRSQVLNGLEFFWVIGTASLSLISFVLKDWWKIQLFCSVPGLVFGIIYIWGLDESPHWLSSVGKTAEAWAVLRKMARWNGFDDKNLKFAPQPENDAKEECADDTEAKKSNKESFWKIWTHKRLVVRFLIFSYAWIVCSLCYYVLSFGVRNLPGNLYINNVISSVVEGIGYLLCFCIAYWGRKWPTVASFFGGGAVLLISALLRAFTPDKGDAITAVSMIGKIFIAASWQMIIVWGGECYPTTHRCFLSSLNTLVGRVGSVLAPLLLDLEKFIDVPNEQLIMPIGFVVLMVLGGFLHMIPAETNNRQMPEFIKEANVIEFPKIEPEKAEDEKFVEEGLLGEKEREQHV